MQENRSVHHAMLIGFYQGLSQEIPRDCPGLKSWVFSNAQHTFQEDRTFRAKLMADKEDCSMLVKHAGQLNIMPTLHSPCTLYLKNFNLLVSDTAGQWQLHSRFMHVESELCSELLAYWFWRSVKMSCKFLSQNAASSAISLVSASRADVRRS